MRFAIIGAGSIGSLFAAYLARSTLEIGVIARESHASAIESNGLRLEVLPDNKRYLIRNIEIISQFSDLVDRDVLLISVKAFDLESILKVLKDGRVVDESRHIIGLIQNGISNEDLVREYFPGVPLFRMVTTNGAIRDAPGVVKHTGHGQTFLGAWDGVGLDRVERIIEIIKKHLNDVGIHAEISGDVKEKIWEKVIVNVGINPVGAIFKIPNGKILENTFLLSISENLVNEALLVARAQGYLMDFDGFKAVKTVLAHTKLNRNSMLQDLDRKRPTEISFINGAISNFGKDLDIKTPWNDVVTAIIRGMESL
ncbi:MAG: ketopantoate reductase family protein [Promethearchaeota archaeon]